MKKLFLLLALLPIQIAAAQNVDKTTGRIGYANLDYIMQRLPQMKEIESQLKSTQTQLRNQIQTKSDELKKQYEQFNATAQTMADTVRMRREQEMQEALGRLEQMQQEAQVSLQNKQKLLMAPLYLKVNTAISQVARENGFDIILTEKVGAFNFLLYKNEQLDVSNLVLAKFGVTVDKK
ncbi:MAG TPA: OmpH family outer membrane protein [Chryseosolibacter sp.]|nr:OmpH family outer membrane protein [Chryseosolibacter sp.]